MSGCLHVTGSCPETPLAQFSAISPSHLGSGPQLCSCWTLMLNNPASAHIAARGLPSKPVPHGGNQPYCSCHGKQAPNSLDPRCYCCRALGVKKTDDAQTIPTSAGAVNPLQPELELTVRPLQIFSCSLRTVALLPFYSLPLQSLCPSSLTATCSFSSAELSWGYPERCTAVCAVEEGECQGKKSWLRALVMCSVVVAVSSRRDPSCRITHSLTVLLRAQQHHLLECGDTVYAMIKRNYWDAG